MFEKLERLLERWDVAPFIDALALRKEKLAPFWHVGTLTRDLAMFDNAHLTKLEWRPSLKYLQTFIMLSLIIRCNINLCQCTAPASHI